MRVLGGITTVYLLTILSLLQQVLHIVNCFKIINRPKLDTPKNKCKLASAIPFEELHCTELNGTDIVCVENDGEFRTRHRRSFNERRKLTDEYDVIKYHFTEPNEIEYVCNNATDYIVKGGVATRQLAQVKKEEKAPNIESPHCVVNVFLPEDRNDTRPGDLVDFVCMTYGGHPLPTVKLYHGDVELPGIDQTFDDTVQFYYRTNVYEEDNGLAFSCVMDTPAVNTQRSCTAQALLIPPTAVVTPTRFMGLLGDSVTFKCNAEGIPSILSYEWRSTPPNAMRKMGKRLQISEDRTSVTVRNMKRQDHKVRLYCTVATVNGLTAESRGKILLDLPTTTLPPTTTVLTTTTTKPTTEMPTSVLVDTADIGPRISITQTPKEETGHVPNVRTMIPPRLPPKVITTESPINATEVGSVIPDDNVSLTQRIIVIVVLCLLFLFILIFCVIWVAYRKLKYTKPRSKLTLDEIVIVKPRAHQDVHTDREDYAVPDIQMNLEDSEGLYSPLRPSNSEAGLFVSGDIENNNTTTAETDAPIYATPMTKRKDPEGSEMPNEDEMTNVASQNAGVTYATCMKHITKNNQPITEASSFEELFKNFEGTTQRRLFSSQSLSSLFFTEDADGYLAPSVAGSQSTIPPSNKPIKSNIERSKSFAAPASEPVYTSLDKLLDKPIEVKFTKADATKSPTKTATKIIESTTSDKPDERKNVPMSKPSKLPRPTTLPPKKPPPKVAKKPGNRNNSSSASQVQRSRPKAPHEQSYIKFTPMFSPEKPLYVPRKPASFIS